MVITWWLGAIPSAVVTKQIRDATLDKYELAPQADAHASHHFWGWI